MRNLLGIHTRGKERAEAASGRGRSGFAMKVRESLGQVNHQGAVPIKPSQWFAHRPTHDGEAAAESCVYKSVLEEKSDSASLSHT